MPLRDYMRDLRLERAHRLLLTSAMSLTAIAAESGFYDLPHLDKALKFRHRYNRRVRPQEDHSPVRAVPGGR